MTKDTKAGDTELKLEWLENATWA